MRSTQLLLLMAPAYGPVNVSVKWQVQWDQVSYDFELRKCQKISQFFYYHENGMPELIAAQEIDDLREFGEDDSAEVCIQQFNKKFTLE